MVYVCVLMTVSSHVCMSISVLCFQKKKQISLPCYVDYFFPTNAPMVAFIRALCWWKLSTLFHHEI
jgi:hypothetical protein